MKRLIIHALVSAGFVWPLCSPPLANGQHSPDEGMTCPYLQQRIQQTQALFEPFEEIEEADDGAAAPPAVEDADVPFEIIEPDAADPAEQRDPQPVEPGQALKGKSKPAEGDWYDFEEIGDEDIVEVDAPPAAEPTPVPLPRSSAPPLEALEEQPTLGGPNRNPAAVETFPEPIFPDEAPRTDELEVIDLGELGPPASGSRRRVAPRQEPPAPAIEPKVEVRSPLADEEVEFEPIEAPALISPTEEPSLVQQPSEPEQKSPGQPPAEEYVEEWYTPESEAPRTATKPNRETKPEVYDYEKEWFDFDELAEPIDKQVTQPQTLPETEVPAEPIAIDEAKEAEVPAAQPLPPINVGDDFYGCEEYRFAAEAEAERQTVDDWSDWFDYQALCEAQKLADRINEAADGWEPLALPAELADAAGEDLLREAAGVVAKPTSSMWEAKERSSCNEHPEDFEWFLSLR